MSVRKTGLTLPDARARGVLFSKAHTRRTQKDRRQIELSRPSSMAYDS